MNEKDYIEHLAILEENAPAHPLLRVLRQGFSLINSKYLEHALRQSRQQAEPPPQTFDFEDPEAEEDTDDPVEDEKLKTWRTQLRSLFRQREELSDKFHDLHTTEERAHNSEDIQIIQRNIARLMQRIRYYKVHGTLPPDDEGGFYVAKDGLELSKQLNSLRANVSRKKRDLRELQEGDLSDMARMRQIEKAERKLAELRQNLKAVEEAIKSLHQK